ncbi:hypothetical protein [Streptomyces erythrochromogenes]|uniref:hypothetical protein n=1 Tax=Streptomyces erythrochromogenes TaxID=285574 RepID=UPI00224D263B|nr:hypothetical protein [Streptomyces erythrochromogenes]MCX5585456.1 hypothetical protein [Streptomyces erythrochromogenes]
MLTETTGRSPQDLAAELAGLKAVDDWPSVWSGPPEGGTRQFYDWCARYGWEPGTIDRTLELRTRSGGEWTFFAEVGDSWTPLRALGHYTWQVSAGSGDENGAVHAAAAEVWPAYLKAAEEVLGAPSWSGNWDSADFPEPPRPDYWSDREDRMETRSPYRFAYWAPDERVPGQPFIVLQQSLSFQAWTTAEPGGSAIALDVFAPTEFLSGDR